MGGGHGNKLKQKKAPLDSHSRALRCICLKLNSCCAQTTLSNFAVPVFPCYISYYV